MTETRNAAVDGTAASTSQIIRKPIINIINITHTPIKFLKCTTKDIPVSLQNINNWILWKSALKDDGKTDKIPLSLTYTKVGAILQNGNAFNKAVDKLNINNCDGLGFILGTHHLVVVDVDHCIDEYGNFTPIAQYLLKKLPTYVEYSQSHHGLHFIFHDENIPEVEALKGHRNKYIEIYTHGRYIALTGWRVEGSPVEVNTLTGMHQELIDEYFPSLGYNNECGSDDSIQFHTYDPVHTNEEILKHFEHDDKFQRLFYDGNIEGYPSQSEADAGLLAKLAHATNCCSEQMRDLFSQSALGKRDKWKDTWYQDYQIENVIRFIKHMEVRIMGEYIKRKDWYTNNLKDYVIQEHNDSFRKSGFGNLDIKQIFKPGLYLLGGIPGMGKTTWSYQLGEQFAANGESVLFMSSELDVNMLFMKSLVRKVKQINPDTSMSPIHIRSLFSNSTINSAVKNLTENDDDFGVMNTENMTVEDIVYNANLFCESHPKPIIIIDYLQYLNTKKTFNSDKQRVDYLIHHLKNFQKFQQSIVILLSAFNRSSYRSAVSMESFKETGDIDATADVMWGLQYDLYKDRESGVDIKGNKLKGITLSELRAEQRKSPRRIMLSCIKNRFGGLYEVYFDYYSDYDLFVEREDYDSAIKLGC